jgi:hypothetical protein
MGDAFLCAAPLDAYPAPVTLSNPGNPWGTPATGARGPAPPKISEKISSALLGLKRNLCAPGPCDGVEGGGALALRPSSPYWSYTEYFCGSMTLSTCDARADKMEMVSAAAVAGAATMEEEQVRDGVQTS